MVPTPHHYQPRRVGATVFPRAPRSCGVQLEYFLVMVVPHNRVLGVLLSSLQTQLLWRLCTPQLLAAPVTQLLIPPIGTPQRLAPLYGCRLGQALMVLGHLGRFRK